MSGYRSRPLNILGLPPGMAYIIGNEAAERFSYYGMRAVLILYMTHSLVDAGGMPDPMDPHEASAWYHGFVMATYFTPVVGAFLADVFLGKYRTILILSGVYCLGHAALAADETRTGLLLGQALIALGSGGIKPCVSAHLGDQFGPLNQSLMGPLYSWFYVAINVGAGVSMLVTPWLMETHGPRLSFGVPGLLMLIATGVFFMGRTAYTHVPAQGRSVLKPLKSLFQSGQIKPLGLLYLTVAIFWSLFDQTGSTWVLQAQSLDAHFLGVDLLPAQIQAANPFLILLLTPLFQYGIYPHLGKKFRREGPVRMAAGMVLAAMAYLLMAGIQKAIDGGAYPSIGWQLLAYLLLTASEVMVSITCLALTYRIAPPGLKSILMAFYLLSVSAGNALTALIQMAIAQGLDGHLLEGARYFLGYGTLVLLAAGLLMRLEHRLKIPD